MSEGILGIEDVLDFVRIRADGGQDDASRECEIFHSFDALLLLSLLSHILVQDFRMSYIIDLPRLSLIQSNDHEIREHSLSCDRVVTV